MFGVHPTSSIARPSCHCSDTRERIPMGQVVQYQRAEKLVMMKGGRKARWRLHDLGCRPAMCDAPPPSRIGRAPTRRLRPTVSSSQQHAYKASEGGFGRLGYMAPRAGVSEPPSRRGHITHDSDALLRSHHPRLNSSLS